MTTKMRIHRVLRVASGLAVLLAAGLAGPAVAQQAPQACPADRWEGWLGISGLSCSRCTIYTVSATEKDWSFATEPEVTRVDPDGPTAGVLQPGDLLVGIDGHLITSREGGQRFGGIRPDERVRLRFLRNGEVHSASFSADGRCRAAELPEAPGAPPLPEVGQAIDSIRPRRPEASPLPPTSERPAAPEMAEAPSPPALPSGAAYLGISFRCGDCRARVDEGRTVWSFSRPPEITAVEAGSPASEAGLRPGDLIRRIDGTDIESGDGGRAFGQLAPDETVLITVSRPDGSWVNVPVTPVPPLGRSSVPSSPSPPLDDVVRFSGTLGASRITVIGGPVSVMKVEASGLLVIRTAENEIRIWAPVPGEGREP